MSSSTIAVRTFNDCVSELEKSQRFIVTVFSILAWIGVLVSVIFSYGLLILVWLFGWLIKIALSEYNIRKLEAIGATVSSSQFPEVHQAVQDVCTQFGVASAPRVVVVSSGETNAFAMLFARKKCVLILSELLDGIIDNPKELRFLLGHEMCHIALAQSFRGHFEIYRPARYVQGRELSCDNAGVAAAGDLLAPASVLKKVCVGRALASRLQENTLIADSDRIYSGFAGWLLKQYLRHPPVGARLKNALAFYERHAQRAAPPHLTALDTMTLEQTGADQPAI